MTATLAPAPIPRPKPCTAPLPGTRLLTVNEQPPRRPLGAWAAELSGNVAAALAEPGTIERARAVTGCGNAASLVMAHAGRLDDAEHIVRAQVAWLHAGADRADQGALLALTLQPWINLGRLHALRGHADAALRHHADVRACRMDAPVTLAGREVLPAHWAAAGWEPAELARFGRSAWIIEGLRVLLAAGRWAGVREMADAEPDAGGAAPFLREARWIALAREGAICDALASVEPALRGGSAWDRMVAHVRRAELFLLAGDDERAAAAIAELVGVLGPIGVEGLQLPALLVVQALASLALTHAPSADALALSARIAEGARRLDDEVMEIEVLRLVSTHAPAAERIRRADALERRTGATGYARLRPRHLAPFASTAVDALLEQMLAALETDGDGP